MDLANGAAQSSAQVAIRGSRCQDAVSLRVGAPDPGWTRIPHLDVGRRDFTLGKEYKAPGRRAAGAAASQVKTRSRFSRGHATERSNGNSRRRYP